MQSCLNTLCDNWTMCSGEVNPRNILYKIKTKKKKNALLKHYDRQGPQSDVCPHYPGVGALCFGWVGAG